MENNYRKLTNRELEVLQLVCEGYNNKEIGQKLWISYYTAKAHVSSIIYKIGARNRTQAAYIAARNKLIEGKNNGK